MTKTLERNVHIEALAKTLGAPSLEGLSYALRHPETWPKKFVWNFKDCESCAMGLAQALWPTQDYSLHDMNEDHDVWVCETARKFGMGYEDAINIFYSTKLYHKKLFGFTISRLSMKDVTPEMVADAIDKYIAKQN